VSDVTAVPLRPVGRKGLVALWAGIACLVTAGVGAAWATAEKPVLSAMSAEDFLRANARRKGVVSTLSGLQYQVIEGGAGLHPTVNDIAVIDYRGTLIDGTQFDASAPGQPVRLPVGQVVPGFAEALMLMPRNARFRVWLPPQLGYGDAPAGPIPPNSVLVFDIHMIDYAPSVQAAVGPQPGAAPTADPAAGAEGGEIEFQPAQP
jgi:FKBP-type peptidyl-prolyl cis-trans isomerase FkpA